jgi:hypothetical protein
MFRRFITTFALASAFFLGVSGTAYADDAFVHLDHALGSAYWHENGDSLEVCDDNPDGHGVRAYIYRPNPGGDAGNGTVLIKASDPSYNQICTWASQDISETISISIKVCRYAGDWVGDCKWKVITR